MFSKGNCARFTLHIPAVRHDFKVLAFNGTEAISQLYSVRIELVSEHPDFDLESLLSQPAFLQFGLNDEGIHGRIEDVMVAESGKRLTRYELTLVPALHYLQFSQDQRIFQQRTVPQIIAQVLETHGIQSDAFTFHINPNPPREYCTQYGESDFMFLQRLCAEDGIAWHHQHSVEGHLLVFTDSPVFAPSLGTTHFQADSGMVAEQSVVNQLTMGFNTRTSTVTRRDYDLQRPSLLLESRFTAEFSPDLEDYRYPLLMTSEKSGKQLARQALERHRSDYQWIEGKSDQARLRSGHLFDLRQHPRPSCNESWLVVTLTHEAKQPQVLEDAFGSNDIQAANGFTQGYRNTFKAIPADVFYRPPLPAPRPPLVCQTARVTVPPGEEIFCDDHGRVRVEFPWDRTERNSEKSSCWLRVASSWAGDGFGAVAIPRIGMEVVVTFLEGNPDHPLITGCVANKVNSVAHPLPASKTRTVLRSQSSPRNGGYNELSIEDRAGQELIYLRAQRDMAQKIGNSLQLEVGNERRETINGSSYTQTGKSFDIEAGQQVHLKAGASVVLDAGASITLKAGGHHLVIDAGGIFSSKEIETGRKPHDSEAPNLLLQGLDGAFPVAPAVNARAEEELEEEEEEVELEDETPGGITLRIGVFFDGTGNNKANSETVAACYAADANLAEAAAEIQQHCATYGYDGNGSSPDNSYGNDVSNIVRLYELYTDHSFETLPEKTRNASLRVYIEGIGTTADAGDSLYAQATGRGETGVSARVEQSPEKIIGQVRSLIDKNPNLLIEKNEFDIFGFSRGAAAARHFANEVLKGERSILADAFPAGSPALSSTFDWRPQSSISISINFIGLFDTVAAIANPWLFDFTGANSRNSGLDLKLPDGCANKVVHLVARDEYRENFALNSLGDTDLFLPGAHSDLGGGYLPRAKEKLLLSNPITSTISRDKDATRSAAYVAAEKEAFAWYAKGVIEDDVPGSQLRVAFWERAVTQSTQKGRTSPDPQKRVYAAASIERPVHGELSLVYLRIMRELAVRHGVPFEEIDENEPRLALPAELIPIHAKLEAYALGKSSVEALTIKERALLRSRYIHLSAHWNAAKGLNSSDLNIVFINRPTKNNQRVVHPHE